MSQLSRLCRAGHIGLRFPPPLLSCNSLLWRAGHAGTSLSFSFFFHLCRVMEAWLNGASLPSSVYFHIWSPTLKPTNLRRRLLQYVVMHESSITYLAVDLMQIFLQEQKGIQRWVQISVFSDFFLFSQLINKSMFLMWHFTAQGIVESLHVEAMSSAQHPVRTNQYCITKLEVVRFVMDGKGPWPRPRFGLSSIHDPLAPRDINIWLNNVFSTDCGHWNSKWYWRVDKVKGQ